MKRLILILLTAVLTVGMLTGCELFQAKEGQIVFSLAEEQESDCTWEYFIEPDGVIEEVRDEIFEANGVLCHDWIFAGLAEGAVGITFQYSKEGEDPTRTVRYTCFVDEKLHVNLMETWDSADEAGTAEDELLIRCISTALSLQYEQGLEYPAKQVSQEYAQAFLLCCANLFYSEQVEKTDSIQYIALDEKTVAELLDVAFGDRFDTLVPDQNSIVSRDNGYYFGIKDHAWVDAIPLDGELQYVFTVMGETESIDGTAQVEVSESSQNSVGLTLTDITSQKSE